MLYLCLEDTERRVQERLNALTDDVPANLYIATFSESIVDGLCEQIESFLSEHPDTSLIAIDTFQMIRAGGSEPSYANDYQEIAKLKMLTNKYNLTLLLVHHLRKQWDSDPLNKLSGTTGISGAVDAVFVLDRDHRSCNIAKLVCTGRDIEYRELELEFDKDTCTWNLRADSLIQPEILLPNEILLFVQFMKNKIHFTGSNSDLVNEYNSLSGNNITSKGLKQLMNKYRYELESNGVTFKSYRSNGQRLVDISFSAYKENSDLSDANDASFGSAIICDTCVTCVPFIEKSEENE